MTQDFVEELKADSRVGEGHADYPLVKGIAAGTLPLRQLQGWITQDYVYRKQVPRLAMLRYLACTDPEIQQHLAEVGRGGIGGRLPARPGTSSCSTISRPGWASAVNSSRLPGRCPGRRRTSTGPS